MPSFDIVSEMKENELRNAVDQANKEVTTRYDFKGVKASFELSEKKIKKIRQNTIKVICL